tara:strand:- start:36 stop:566 length:531 start_codon:yes stop_codon:yes gene_type:complete
MKKRTLNESTVRRFMKLANMSTLTENYFSNLREDELEEGEGMYARDEEEAMGMDAELDLEPEAPADELPEVEPEPAAAPTGDVDVVALVDAITDAVTKETGVPITTTEEAPVEEEPEADLAPEAPAEEPMLEEVTVDIPQETIDEETTTDKEVQEENLENLVNEVARRVAERLTKK